ncbi:CpsD/CapB family tyrosine-protein kinase [Methylomicrobium sp. Wu6]|uniref:CpsD/CapB family tyrosine-protein kinase n=1 Tax=Methylomicrobium sp. Wu6 TaxID=3107928 RepID=UPI002DD68FE7|nr:CpsD/CapB family tyrosine-protein kinase [Methylomicrobium sp. Wu6]MEC4749593.1 CpsD/CapB family tyrosine-protein kinase [Methylomicrobium sp. Wu6]
MNSGANGRQNYSTRYTQTQTAIIDPDVLRNNRVIMGLYNDPRADIFRVLRTNILRQLRENNWNSFAITSATPGAGKTFISVNLAIAIAMEGNQSVLLIDADLRRPNVGQYLGLQCKYGFVDYLAGGTPLENILINPGIENLVLLPGKDSNINYSELISSKIMANLIKEIKSRYESRIIIFDIPPIFVADDALLLMPYVDAGLLVVEDGKNTSDELQQAMYILEQTNLLGLVLNKARQPLPIYHYGYVSESSKY